MLFIVELRQEKKVMNFLIEVFRYRKKLKVKNCHFFKVLEKVLLAKEDIILDVIATRFAFTTILGRAPRIL